MNFLLESLAQNETLYQDLSEGDFHVIVHRYYQSSANTDKCSDTSSDKDKIKTSDRSSDSDTD